MLEGETMKYLKAMTRQRVFEYSFVHSLTGSRSLADKIISSYIEKGFIKRIKRNLFCAISLESGRVIPTKYEIASSINDEAFVSHQSALEYHGYMHQVYHEIIVSSTRAFQNFEFDGIFYKYKYTSHLEAVIKEKNVKVTTLERTVIDMIDSVRSYDDLEEVLQSLKMIPLLHESTLLMYLESLNKRNLYNKTGLILSFFKNDFQLNESFFKSLKAHLSESKKYFTKEKKRLDTYYEEWKLYSYNILKIIGE